MQGFRAPGERITGLGMIWGGENVILRHLEPRSLEAQLSGALLKTPRSSHLSALTFSHSISCAVYTMRWSALTVHAYRYAWIHMSAVPSAEYLIT